VSTFKWIYCWCSKKFTAWKNFNLSRQCSLPTQVVRRIFAHQAGQLLRISNRAQQRILRLSRIQTGVLHHDGHVGFDDGGVVGILWDGFRIAERVESQV